LDITGRWSAEETFQPQIKPDMRKDLLKGWNRALSSVLKIAE